MNRTRFAGLTQLEPGEPWTTDNSSFQSQNPEIVDRFLEIGAVTHRHDGRNPLADPTQEVFASAVSSGGQIEPELTPSITYTLIDDSGGETLAAPAVIASTRTPMAAPSSGFIGQIDYTGGGLLYGNYYYGLTFVDGIGGETAIGPYITVARDPGFSSARVNLTGLNAEMLNVGAAGWRLYRAVGGGSFGFLASGTGGSFVDDGSKEPICDLEPPDAFNQTTFFNNSLIVRVPSGIATASAAGAQSFRVYIAPDGDLANGGLMAAYPMSSAGRDIVYRQLDPTFEVPPDVATTLRGARQIDPDRELLDWHWKRPVASAGMLGSGAAGDVRIQLSPARIAALLKDAPAGGPNDWTYLDGVTTSAASQGSVSSAKIIDFVGANGATIVVSSGADGRALVTITASGNVQGSPGVAGPPGAPVAVGNPRLNDVRFIEFDAEGGLGVHVDDLGGGSARVAYSASGVAGTGGGTGKISVGLPTLLNKDHVEFQSSGGAGISVQDLGGSSALVLVGAASAGVSSGGSLPHQTFVPLNSTTSIAGPMRPIEWQPLTGGTYREAMENWSVGSSVASSANSELVCSETGWYLVQWKFQINQGPYNVSPTFRKYNAASVGVANLTDVEHDPTFSASALNGTNNVYIEHTAIMRFTAGQKLLPMISHDSPSAKLIGNDGELHLWKLMSRPGGAGGAQGPPGDAGTPGAPGAAADMVDIAGSAGVGILRDRAEIDFVGSGGIGVAVQDKGGGSAQVLVGAPPAAGGAALDVAIFTQNGSRTVTGAGAAHGLDWTETRDDNNRWTVTNTVFGGADEELTVAAAGVYVIEVIWNISAGNYLTDVCFRHYNSAPALQRGYEQPMSANTGSGNQPDLAITRTVTLAAGDKILPLAAQASGSNKTVSNGRVTITKIA